MVDECTSCIEYTHLITHIKVLHHGIIDNEQTLFDRIAMVDTEAHDVQIDKWMNHAVDLLFLNRWYDADMSNTVISRKASKSQNSDIPREQATVDNISPSRFGQNEKSDKRSIVSAINQKVRIWCVESR